MNIRTLSDIGELSNVGSRGPELIMPHARKDDRADTVPLPSAPTAADYRAILERSRTQQLALTRENLTRLARTFDDAAQKVLERVRALPDSVERNGTGWLAAQLNLIRDIDETLVALRRDFGDLLDLSMLSSAQQVADREREVERLVGAPQMQNLVPTLERTATLTNGASLSVRFGTLAQGAVERAATRYYGDGLKLSDRLYSLDTQMRQSIENTVTRGIADGSSARNIAKELESTLVEAHAANPRYRAMTIARTEVNAAFRESAVRSSVSPDTGMLKPYISAIGFRLSSSHKLLDRCDLYAADDTGLGPGNYLPGDVPTNIHPACMCGHISVLVALPDEQFVRKEPDAAGVPESEVRRMAQREGDPVAQRWLARAGGG